MDYIYVFDCINLKDGIFTSYQLSNNVSLEEHYTNNKEIWQWTETMAHYRTQNKIEDINITNIKLIEYTDRFNFKLEINIDNDKILNRYQLLLQKIRTWRNKKLIDTDIFFQISDYPVDQDKKNELLLFRINLRDLPLKINSDNILNYFTIIDSKDYVINEELLL